MRVFPVIFQADKSSDDLQKPSEAPSFPDGLAPEQCDAESADPSRQASQPLVGRKAETRSLKNEQLVTLW